jgi:hopanoid-associated phosphorylase
LSAAGVVAALSAEALTLGYSTRRSDGLLEFDDGTLAAVSGTGCDAAAAAAHALAAAGATALISWGLAGGLDPALSAGTICLPCAVIHRGGAFATDHHWRELVTAAISARHTVVSGTVLTSAVAIDGRAGKAAAFHDTGAVAVDMESGAVAEVAAARGLPFIAVRVIVDAAGDTLPATALAAMTSTGSVRLLSLIGGLIRNPRDIAPLIRLALRYRTATRALTIIARTGVLAPLAFGAGSPARIL